MHTFIKLISAVLLVLSLTAWGVDASPRRHKGKFTKHYRTGPSVLGGSTFKVNQHHNPNYKRTANSGPVELAKTYKKFNVLFPDQLSNAIAGIVGRLQGTDGVPAKVDPSNVNFGTVETIPEAFDREYLSPVQIGTPAQTVNLNFDTGSADLWVNTNETPENQQNGQKEYNPTLSSTASRMDGATWDITYGDGSASSGIVYLDTVTIGGVTVQKQAVESAQKVSSSFQSDAASSGLLGLGFGSINTVQPQQQKTFFENAMNDLASPLFTVNLMKQAAGSYDFGYINESEHTGEIKYTPVDNTRGFWGFNPTGFQVGNSSFNSTNWFAIADTGTSLLLLPSDIVDNYWSNVQGAFFDALQGGYTFPCKNPLPSFSFGIEEYRGVVPGHFMNYASISNLTCFGGIQSSDALGFSIFGDVVLKAQFVVFDGGDNTLGWANKDLSSSV
ncbi:hypothetical protein V495_01496 [Pseudogymnoascus sp. VKM F-4514 (FW-929)]|nr:hypothetical protein V490_08296 [Pseudogymnoascus sp. VKM F-3557]KFY48252.1 hypothetical protein V495_01496 [Pseudogymnoascus sp. VKM F-4514 (FW-929)]KFY62042.1 hypothetical protein V497_02637 [Pseudogymnoascus sp. VKM F-4516 (FW-969)]